MTMSVNGGLVPVKVAFVCAEEKRRLQSRREQDTRKDVAVASHTRYPHRLFILGRSVASQIY